MIPAFSSAIFATVPVSFSSSTAIPWTLSRSMADFCRSSACTARSRSSITSGLAEREIFTRAALVSSRSTALSGSCRPEM